MSKRKGAAPRRADESKRQALSWNMLDMNHDLTVLGDLDPRQHEEQPRADPGLSDLSTRDTGQGQGQTNSSGGQVNILENDGNVGQIEAELGDFSGGEKNLETNCVVEGEHSGSIMLGENGDVFWVDPEYTQQRFSPCPSESESMSGSEIGGFTTTTYERDEHLKGMINNSEFYVSIYTQDHSKLSKWSCKIGEFNLSIHTNGTELPKTLPNVEEFWLYVMSDSNLNHLIYYEVGQNLKKNGRKETAVVYFEATSDLPHACLSACQPKPIVLVAREYDSNLGRVIVDLYVVEGALTSLSFSSEWFAVRPTCNALMMLMAHFHDIQGPDLAQHPYTKKHDIKSLYEEIRSRHMRDLPALHADIQHPSLKPRLRHYQKQAVMWMLTRERYQSSTAGNHGDHDYSAKKLEPDWNAELLHPLYEEFHSLDGQLLYYNRRAGYLVRKKPLAMGVTPGGILADEMGLGKTVEMLACILTHPRTGLTHIEPLHSIDNEDLDTELTSEVEAKPHTSLNLGCSYPSEPHPNHVTAEPESTPTVNALSGAHSELHGDERSERPGDERSECPGDERSERHGDERSERPGDERSERPGDPESVERVRKLECICGAVEFGIRDSVEVECGMCGLYQHADCVHYDLQDPYRGVYLCPQCHVIAPALQSGATLIISPSSISHQWVEEINKHIHEESIKVMVYTGVQKQGFIQPRTLASQDIVIMSYETLRKETNYVDLPHSNSKLGRKFRTPKRFMAIPSPIVAVEWWRICLDEAQMVESVTTKTADMALRLKAVNKWCVTGTPIQRSIEDLYGLLLFLGLDPYWVRPWWTELLFKPFCHGQKEALYAVLTDTLWRTAKNDVLDQICLPSQAEEVHWLTFSPVEEHFYRRQYQECAREAMQRLRKWTDSGTKLSSLDRTTLHQLLYPLVRLRQACCHPQAVRGEFLPIHKSTMTMDELLNQLIKKQRVECEESHRQLVFALNGLAALHLIAGEAAEAVDKYRCVLRSSEDHKSEIRTDELQLLHTLYNLSDVLAGKPQGVPPTLRDDQLNEQITDIKTRYIMRFELQVTQAQDAWTPNKKSVHETSAQLKKKRDWWTEILQWANYADLDTNLVQKIKDDLADNRNAKVMSLATRFRDVRGLQYILTSHLDELQRSHDELLTMLQELSTKPSADLISITVECCLRPAAQTMAVCPFCEADKLFQTYESKLFSFVEKGLTEEKNPEEDNATFLVATRRQGTWADSECERALKTIISFGKSWGGDSRVLEYGGIHIKLLEALKKEFKCLRTLWLYLRERVSALDELDMATMRMRVRGPEEPKSDVPQPNVLERSELGAQKLKLQSDHVIYKNELTRKLGQLLYLQNLATAQTPLEDGQNPALCPICQKKLGTKWSVLQCGHCYCMECVRILVVQYSFGTHSSFKCPVCRQRTRSADISYVSTKQRDAGRGDDIKVKGDHSTKVEGIVHCLLKIRRQQPEAKTLVFSTWPDVLDVLSTALTENGVGYRSLYSRNKFQKNLDSFKHESDVQVLLLPVHSGSNGLNLIEATHVVLVEPILNPAQELQAIGRVHRIGQTKQTVVHRFMVRGTIEERMNHLLQTVQMPTNTASSEATTLTIGEFSSLFEDIVPNEEEVEEEEEMESQGVNDLMSNGGTVTERVINILANRSDVMTQMESTSSVNADSSAAIVSTNIVDVMVADASDEHGNVDSQKRTTGQTEPGPSNSYGDIADVTPSSSGIVSVGVSGSLSVIGSISGSGSGNEPSMLNGLDADEGHEISETSTLPNIVESPTSNPQNEESGLLGP